MLSLSIRKKRGNRQMSPRIINKKKTYFEMVKITKSNPISKRDRVKNELCPLST
jgi:hypothetical protein